MLILYSLWPSIYNKRTNPPDASCPELVIRSLKCSDVHRRPSWLCTSFGAPWPLSFYRKGGHLHHRKQSRAKLQRTWNMLVSLPFPLSTPTLVVTNTRGTVTPLYAFATLPSILYGNMDSICMICRFRRAAAAASLFPPIARIAQECQAAHERFAAPQAADCAHRPAGQPSLHLQSGCAGSPAVKAFTGQHQAGAASRTLHQSTRCQRAFFGSTLNIGGISMGQGHDEKCTSALDV